MEKGYFVISDISGYTSFLTESELEHANDILKAITETLIRNVTAPLRISNLQGDAIFMYAPAREVLVGQTLVHQIEKIYYEFKKLLQTMRFSTTCRCKACSNIPGLDLKFFIHIGDYATQKFNEREELTGTDVILVHRLMKNDVVEKTGVKAYALFTDRAAAELGVDLFCEGLKEYRQEVEKIGEVKAKIHCLHTAWKKDLQSEKDRVVVDPGKALVRLDMTLPVAPDVAWNYLTRADLKRAWLGMDEVTHTPAAGRGYGKGSRYQCAHSMGELNYIVRDWRPFQYLTVDGTAPGGFTYRQMDLLKPTKEGSNYTVLMAPRSTSFIQGILNNRQAKKMRDGFQQFYEMTHSGLQKFIGEHQRGLH